MNAGKSGQAKLSKYIPNLSKNIDLHLCAAPQFELNKDLFLKCGLIKYSLIGSIGIKVLKLFSDLFESRFLMVSIPYYFS